MKILHNVFFILISMFSFGQNTIWHTMPQYDANKINVRIITDKALKGFKPQSQYIGVEVTNKTNDILFVRVEYWAVTGCGSNVKGELGATESGERLNPAQIARPSFSSNMHSFNVVDRLSSGCSDKEGLRRKVGEDQYSWITDVGYRIISIENISEKERQKATEEKKKEVEQYIKQGNQYYNNKSYENAIKNYEKALELDPSNGTAKQSLSSAKSAKAKLAEEENKKQEQQKGQPTNTTSSNNSSSDFWNETSSQTPQKSKEQIAADKRLQESRDRYAEQENRFFNTMEKQKQQEERNDVFRQTSYYLAERQSQAERRVFDNASFNRKFDNVEDLNRAFQQQVSQINASANELAEVKNENLSNNLNYSLQDTDATTQAVGQGIALIGNIINNASAESDRKYALEKLEKERKEQIARIEAERKQKILNLRNEIFQQYPQGGVPLSRHNINLEELYFFTYWYDGKTSAKVSNVFPYSKYKDGTWAFKDKVTAESEKAVAGKVTLVGYFTAKELAEKERNVFVQLLPQAEVNVNTFTVKGRKWDGAESGSTDFWGNEKQENPEQTTTETQDTTPQKTDDFWGETKTEKKTETKKSDSFWD